jgi:STE24 endopeptidase
MKKSVLSYNWAFNFTILAVVLGFVMLAVLLIFSLMIKPAAGTDVTGHFNNNFLIKAADYNKSVMLISIAERFISWATMIALLAVFWKNTAANSRIAIYWAIVIFIVFNIILYMAMLPLQYFRDFVLAHRFGLSNQSLFAWLIDVLKDRAISLIINSSIITLLYVLIIKFPKNWWIAAASILILFFVLANFIFPVLIDPLFYKFTPLKDESLQKEIQLLADKAQIKVSKILIADASKKTNTVNAYFSGIGSTKRIVIYDNLLNNYTRSEVLSVIAHEIGHWRYRHILFNTIIGCAEIILLVFILKIVQSGLQANAGEPVKNIFQIKETLQTQPVFQVGFSQPFNFGVKLVTILFILYSFLSYIIMPLDNFVSRQFEKQADKAALELTADANAQVKIFENLAVSNLSNVRPGKVLEYIIFSHPPIMDRINSALKE